MLLVGSAMPHPKDQIHTISLDTLLLVPTAFDLVSYRHIWERGIFSVCDHKIQAPQDLRNGDENGPSAIYGLPRVKNEVLASEG